ncbi:hypothetical protein IFM89_024922 [Coptis chinensis]|uniref:UBA domain-containing protein n=1 Tax=Coptis chinensis TaxID=261450 RepID=A0A835LJB5_9MAGN|nr:hypothetical protein IFM89_024922 [Coptis chinensis]
MLRFSGEETKNFLMGGGMVLLVTWRRATRLEVSAVVIRALLFLLWKRSILPGICGVLLYRSNILGIRRIKFPEFVSLFFSRLSWPTLGGSSPPASGGNVIENIPSYTGCEVEASTGNYPSVAPLASTVEPSDNSIGTLVSMGFDRSSARQALVQARNDVNVATNILLEAQSH